MIFRFCMKLLHIGQSDIHFYLIQPVCSNYHLFAISFEHHFFPTSRRESLQLLLKSRYETDSTDSNNWIIIIDVSVVIVAIIITGFIKLLLQTAVLFYGFLISLSLSSH